MLNEIAWMGRASSTNDEWIELKNLSARNIDLTGWSISAADGSPKIDLSGNIFAGDYFLLERKVSTVTPLPQADLLYDYNVGALGNGGESLLLKDDQGNVIDAADFSQGWKWNGSAAGDAASRRTAERCGNDWQTSLDPGGTPGAANDCASEESPAAPTTEPAAAAGGSSAPIYRHGDVLINEFASDPSPGENEWVELYNPSGGKISLAGWTISDGSGAATPLSGGFDADNYYFFVAEKFKGALNNDGDEINLYSDTQNLIDKVTYGKFGDQPDNNAPAPGKGESADLKIDGQKNSFDKDSYAISETPTKGKPNIISPREDAGGSASSSDSAACPIAITEIFPNPIGSDRNSEFIELHNNSAAAVDLTGYKIEIAGGRGYEFGKFFNLTRQLAPQAYWPLYRSESNLVLDNNGGTIKLFAPGKSRAAQSLQYDAAEEGLSYVDTANLDLARANSATKKFLNNSLLLDHWVWSMSPTPGAANQIKPVNHPPTASFSAPAKIVAGAAADFDASDSYDEDGDPLIFSWDFGNGEEFDSEIVSHIFIQPGNYQIKLAASDGEETATLNKIIKVTGSSLIAAGNDKIAANGAPLALPEKSIAAAAKPPAIVAIAAAKAALNGTKSAGTVKKVSSPAAPLSAVKPLNRYKLGAGLKLRGQVLVLPGVFGSQYFYLLLATDSPAVKIYNYYKNFPALKIGDLVSVSGVIGGSAADKYLKTKSAADIKIISAGTLPAPEKIMAADFIADNLDKFARAEGEVESKSGSQITLFDGSADFKVYLKASANLSASSLKAGAKVTATGLLTSVSGGLAIMPRAQTDLAIASSGPDAIGQILGAATGSSAWTMPAGGNNSSATIYILIAAGGIFVILAGWLAKKIYSKRRPAAESPKADSAEIK